MKYTYKARTQEGQVKEGVIEASSREAAASLLQKYGIFVTSLQEQSEKISLFKNVSIGGKVNSKDLSIFSRQLAVMLESRVPMVQSLTSLAVQVQKPNFKEIIMQVAGSVEEGTSLSEAFARFPKSFDNFYVNLVKSGELSGKISGSLYYISEHLEREQDIRGQVKQAMIYPIFTIASLFIVINIVIVFLLPKIRELIAQSTNDPPPFTVLMLSFYQFLESYWWMMMLAFAVAVVALVFYARTREGQKVYDQYCLKIPVLGDILRKVFLTRFCANISTLMAAGISINKSLKITEETVNNSVYKGIIAKIGDRVSEGESISSVLVQYQEYFPAFVIQMIKVGEETGKLDTTLMEVVDFYQKEIKKSIDFFLALLEPLLIIFLGGVVSILAVSVFAPLYGALGNV